jgi:hypothetical protein
MSNKRLAVRVMEPVLLRAHTRDSAPRRPSRDTLLKAEELLKNPAMLGKTWAGDFTALLGTLSSMSSSDRAIAIDEAQRALASYGQSIHASGTMRAGPAGSLATSRPEMEFAIGTDATPDDLNSAAKAFWADGANRAPMRDVPPPRGGIGPVSIEEIQRANDAFWKQQTAHQKTVRREWGKG